MNPATVLLCISLLLAPAIGANEPAPIETVNERTHRIEQLANQLAEDPSDIQSRLELAFTLLEVRDYEACNRHIAYLLANADRYAAHEQARRHRSDRDILSGLTQIVEFVRSEVSNLGYVWTIPPTTGFQAPNMALAQQRFAAMFSPEYASEPAPFEATLSGTDRARLKPIHDLIVTLESRRAIHGATARDSFVLTALTASEEAFGRILESVQHNERLP